MLSTTDCNRKSLLPTSMLDHLPNLIMTSMQRPAIDIIPVVTHTGSKIKNTLIFMVTNIVDAVISHVSASRSATNCT